VRNAPVPIIHPRIDQIVDYIAATFRILREKSAEGCLFAEQKG
jgi:hypothetical protein